MSEVERFKLALERHMPALWPDPEGSVVRYSDHLERVEELERERDQMKRAADGLFDDFMGQQQRFLDLLSEAVEEFERRSALRGTVGHLSPRTVYLTAADYLQERLDGLQIAPSDALRTAELHVAEQVDAWASQGEPS